MGTEKETILREVTQKMEKADLCPFMLLSWPYLLELATAIKTKDWNDLQISWDIRGRIGKALRYVAERRDELNKSNFHMSMVNKLGL